METVKNVHGTQCTEHALVCDDTHSCKPIWNGRAWTEYQCKVNVASL